MADQYNKLVDNTLKYPYLIGITTESGNLGTGILVSGRLALTCRHVLRNSTTAELIYQGGSTSAQLLKVDDSLDLALLELTRPISTPEAKFKDFPLQPGAVLLAVGVQATPGQPAELSVAEIGLKYQNANYANGKILDMQLEGGARPGYSGGPVVVEEDGALFCVGVLRAGGPWAATSNAVGLASIRAFLAEHIPDIPEGNSGANRKSIRRLLTAATILFGAVVAGATAGWHYLASNSTNVASGPPIATLQIPKKTASGEPPAGQKTPTPQPQRPGNGLNPVPPEIPDEPKRFDHGNPNVKVWVNTASNVYHCPGTRWYGNTKHGEYMTQDEAQKKANRPARGTFCE